MTGDDYTYVGVYDGHGGAHTSRFLREHSYAEFEKQLEKTRDPKAAFERAWEAVTRCANFLRLAKESERGGVAQHLVEYALDKAAQRLQRQEPELGVKNRQDLLKIPPGRDGRKYLHDDITVSVVVLGTPGSRYPGAAAARLKLFGSDLMAVPGLRQRRFPRPAKRQPWPSPGVGRAGGRSRRAST